MRDGTGHGHAQGALAAAAFTGNDQEVTFIYGHGDIIQDGCLLLIIDVRQMFHGNEAILGRLQIIHAVVRRDFLFFQGIEDAPGNEEAQGREIHERCNNSIQSTDDDDQGQHGRNIDDRRQIHDELQYRDESAAAHAGRCKTGQDGQARMAFELDEGQVLDDERTGQGAERFTDEVAVRKARLRGQDVDQSSDQADAQSLLITRLGQANGDAIGRNGPVRRDTADTR